MPPINLIQFRIANISVGPSTVRGQPKETVKKAREYLKSIHLQNFTDIGNEQDFQNTLNEYTLKLQQELPSKSWGIARKVMNIFLFQATHDVLLNREFFLDNIKIFLEIPLDNPNSKKLKEFAKKEEIDISWRNIYSLQPDINQKFQDYAGKYALETYQCERCYLDVYWWRS